MKKLFLSVVFSVLYVTSASADLGVNIGVSGNAGIFAASANESHTTAGGTNQNGSEHGSAGWGSVFIEKTIGDRLMIGIDYVPAALETDTTESARGDKQTAGSETVSQVTNKIQIDFEDLTTIYIGAKLNDNFYVKGGAMHVDVITNESLGTGGSYPNVDLDGILFGMGYEAVNDNGTFFRFEGNYLQFDGTTVTNANTAETTIKLKNLDGVSGKISIGKTF